MKKMVLIYGLFLALLSILLKTTEYWFWVKRNAFDIYGALIALIFLGGGIWLGSRFNQNNQKNKEKLVESLQNIGFLGQNTDLSSGTHEGASPIFNEQIGSNLGITKREFEVLGLLGKGMSNQEIAAALFISQNTVKTHTSRLFEKLDVKNRTHAILKAKELGLATP